MGSVTIGLAVMVAGLALAAAPAGAQSRSTGPLQSGDGQAAISASPYAFMNTVGFPQEWHAHKRPVAEDQETASPRRPAPAARDDEGQARRQTPRLVAEAARPATHLPRSGRSYPDLRRSAPRTVPVVEEDYAEPPLKPRRAAVTRRTYTVPSRTPLRSQPTERASARPRASQGNTRAEASPYAFINSVGFPQPYVSARAATSVSADRRAARPVTRRTSRSRTTVPPGFVEVQ